MASLKTPSLRSVVTIALVTTISAAVSGSAAWAQSQSRDSLGVEIVETPGPVGRAPSQLRVRSDPELQIGLIDGAAEYLFSGISGVALLEGGQIAVVQAESADLRFYDLNGQFVRRSGGPGQGPGELMRPVLLNTTRGDSVVIGNLSMSARITIYSSGDQGYRTVSWDRFALGAPGAVWGDRAITTGVEGGGSLPGEEGLLFGTEYIQLVDRRRLEIDTLDSAPFEFVAVPIPPSNVGSVDYAPFGYRTNWAVGDERFFITSPNGTSIHEYDWDGRLRRILRLLEPPTRVTREEMRRAVERRVERAGPRQKRPYERVWGALEPGIKPAFQDLIVDPLGWVWAKVYQADVSTDQLGVTYFPQGTTMWLLFDPEGRGRGSVVLPERLSVQDISRDFVAGIWRDDFDVEHVRLHRIEGR